LGSVNPLAAYRETRVKTASPGQIIVMLYAEAVKQLDAAIEYLEKDIKKRPDLIEKTSAAVVRTQDIITELMASLDFEAGGEIAKNLFALYMFFNHELIDANIRKDVERIKGVRRMMDELRGAWVEVVTKAVREGFEAREGGVNIAG
jgi:flagellar secretion chaperone FliS